MGGGYPALAWAPRSAFGRSSAGRLGLGSTLLRAVRAVERTQPKSKWLEFLDRPLTLQQPEGETANEFTCLVGRRTALSY